MCPMTRDVFEVDHSNVGNGGLARVPTVRLEQVLDTFRIGHDLSTRRRVIRRCVLTTHDSVSKFSDAFDRHR